MQEAEGLMGSPPRDQQGQWKALPGTPEPSPGPTPASDGPRVFSSNNPVSSLGAQGHACQQGSQ